MANQVIINDLIGAIDKDTITDYIDLMYDGKDNVFVINVHVGFLKDSHTTRGTMSKMSNRFILDVYVGAIAEAYKNKKPVGGNNTIPQSIKHGIYLNLCHELRHAHQSLFHVGNEDFFAKKTYFSRPAEVDARRFVDENYEVINTFLDIKTVTPIKRTSSDDILNEFIDGLAASACDGLVLITADQVKLELADLGKNNPISVGIVNRSLADRGFRLS